MRVQKVKNSAPKIRFIGKSLRKKSVDVYQIATSSHIGKNSFNHLPQTHKKPFRSKQLISSTLPFYLRMFCCLAGFLSHTQFKI